ncbi:MAG TPA: TIGR03435 family protein [Vicinamibacterales bacterium]|nr:TIGR03435 family protein [Vicinamibacterales bacterium]
MKRALSGVGVAALLSAAVLAQSAAPQPAFTVADVHASPRSTTTVMRVALRAGRYEIRNATMVDLIRTAYAVDADKVLGGPSWLEYDRFDVAALVPTNTTLETAKPMLRTLLADRFQLAVRNDTKPAAGHVLVMGRGNHKLKAADSASAPGCQTQTVPARQPSGVPGQIVLPMTGLTCRNVTMETFAADLRRLTNGYVTNAVLDQTGLKGSWDFDLQFTQRAILGLAASMDGAQTISLSDAIDKQLGLRLEERDIPTPVLVVEQVNATPTANVPDVAAKLPPPPPMEFEVADLKPVDPDAPLAGPVQFGVSPGGRVNLPGRFLSLKALVALAWNIPGNTNGEIIGAPKWLDTARFDVIAKLPSDLAPTGGLPPLQELGPALQALLIERFKMKVHYEDRPVDAHTLVAVRPKLKKADPSTRTGCKAANANFVISTSVGLPARAVTCQNITMAQFADQLLTIGGNYLAYPVVDATGLEGAWDFTLSFSPISPQQMSGLLASARAGAPQGAAGPADATASDPIGGAATLFDAIEKQLGLKLEVRKRTLPVFVIDHIEEKPTEN